MIKSAEEKRQEREAIKKYEERYRSTIHSFTDQQLGIEAAISIEMIMTDSITKNAARIRLKSLLHEAESRRPR